MKPRDNYNSYVLQPGDRETAVELALELVQRNLVTTEAPECFRALVKEIKDCCNLSLLDARDVVREAISESLKLRRDNR